MPSFKIIATQATRSLLKTRQSVVVQFRFAPVTGACCKSHQMCAIIRAYIDVVDDSPPTFVANLTSLMTSLRLGGGIVPAKGASAAIKEDPFSEL
jgi:hypothetical protein